MEGIPIFPDNGLANSVIPPVFIGLSISTFFTETLGWNFSGLIVPGYLAPILIVKPLSGIVIIIEALLTYATLRLLSDGLSRFGLWTRFFGQDAFFALFCVSILIKGVLEGPLLPQVSGIIDQIFPGAVDYQNEFHSTGLIVVPLMANIFWRHGVRRNIFPALSVIGLTYLATQYILIPYTNFSVSTFELMYSKMAINFEESPRYYFILLVGTAMASHNKYRYGWAYHGMLIPALLGIAWLTPTKILTTFIEAGLILVIGSWIVKRRFMRNVAMEGPRKLLFLFSIGFGLKMLLGFWILHEYPGFQASDLYGFAYILPALIAMEMWPGRYYLKVARVTIQTSLLAAILGVLAAVIILPLTSDSAITSFQQDRHNQTDEFQSSQMVAVKSGNLVPWLSNQLSTRLAYGADYDPLSLKTLSLLDRRVLTPIVNNLSMDIGSVEFEKMVPVLTKTGLQLIDFRDEENNRTYWIIMEQSVSGYQGIYIIRRGSSRPMIIEIPDPLTEIRTIETGLELFEYWNARACFISGTSRRNEYAEFDVTHLETKRSLFQLAHQVFQRESIEKESLLALQVRGAEDLTLLDCDMVISTAGEMRNTEHETEAIKLIQSDLEKCGYAVHRYQGIPADVHFSVRSNAQFVYTESFQMGEFAALWISREVRSAFTPVHIEEELLEQLALPHQEGYLISLVNQRLERFDQNEPAKYDQSVLETIARQLKNFNTTGNIHHLAAISEYCSELGFSLLNFHDLSRNTDFLVITMDSDSETGTVIFNFKTVNSLQLVLTPEMTEIRSILDCFYMGKYEYLILQGDQS
ncbi:poly-gamma-glutamate biosynthesis protein PgsC/CapC [bacterium]|nr:poly-gamma-glutamate biosynthesis protein PgsC/CapC [candidate division CSSED10-310 bacterium]